MIVDVSSHGLRVETELRASPGDAVKVELPDSTLLAQAVYCERKSSKAVMGLRLFGTVKREQVKANAQPATWSQAPQAEAE